MYATHDIGVFTSLNQLFFRDLFHRLIGTEQDIEPDCSSVKRGFLTDERHMTPVIRHVQILDILPIQSDFPNQRIVKPLEHLDRCRFPTSRRTHEGDIRSRRHVNSQVPQNPHSRSGGVPKVNSLDADVPCDFFRCNVDTFVRHCVHLGLSVCEAEDASCRTVGFRGVGYETEDVSSLNSSEDDGGEDSEEFGNVDFALSDPECTDVENESNDEETHTLTGGVEGLRLDGSAADSLVHCPFKFVTCANCDGGSQ